MWVESNNGGLLGLKQGMRTADVTYDRQVKQSESVAQASGLSTPRAVSKPNSSL